MRCPKCENMILQKSEGDTKMRTKGLITFSKSGRCVAQCYWCGNKVYVPVELKKSSAKFVLGGNKRA